MPRPPISIQEPLDALVACDDGYYSEDGCVNGRVNEPTYNEALIAKWLDYVGIRYEYEPTCYRLGTHTGWQIDLYLPDHDFYIEAFGKKDLSKYIKQTWLYLRWPTIEAVVLSAGMIRRIVNDDYFLAMSEAEVMEFLRTKRAAQIKNNDILGRILIEHEEHVRTEYPGLWSIAYQDIQVAA